MKKSNFIIKLTGQPVYIVIASGILFSFVSALLLMSSVITDKPPFKDGYRNFLMAYNYSRYGVITFEDIDTTGKKIKQITREPLYPVLVGLWMNMTVPGDLTINGIKNSSTHMRNIKYCNVFLFILLLWSTGITSWILFRKWGYAVVSMAMISFHPILLEKANRFYTEIPGALLLLLSSLCMYTAWRKKNIGWSAAAGVLVALLAYVKAVFFYFILLFAVTGILYRIAVQFCKQWKICDPETARKILVAAFISFFLVLPWVVRNYSVDSSRIQFATRGSRILAIRAEFDSLSFQEQSASFIAYTRFLTPDMKKKILGEDVYSLFDRDDPDSVYKRFEAEGKGTYYAFKTDNSLSDTRAALLLIGKNFFGHLYMTLAFIHRSIYMHDALKAVPVLSLYGTIMAFLLVPVFIFTLIRTVIRLDTDLGPFLFLPAFWWAFHAFFTHFYAVIRSRCYRSWSLYLFILPVK